MQKQDKQRTKKMSREQQLKVKKDMELPVNKFLNAQTKDGKIKYPIAEKLRKYFISNPDPILNDMRLSNALLHEIRWHKKQSEKYLGEHGAAVIKMKDKEGRRRHI